ncbi:hypothetical protein [Helicobacter trogontum]|uniref:Uncharacterized protein n=1 Tax=Helicobacter trogontum TaxID=50960 RepID=A0A4U8S1X5_9HELI|nr:hypothetical protein [Helicobacter trogontum]TLD79695.1 hypothetical protein LS81_010430 [Helicobacter trogontum]
MQGAIFRDDIAFWTQLLQEYDKAKSMQPTDIQFNQIKFDSILKTLKSYRPSPNGNGIKWSKEEKEAFIKLSLKEQRKMIVRKSELKSTLFPYVNVDYEPYTYSERISDMAKKTYTKAQALLEKHNNTDFNLLDSKIQQEILHNLRVAYKEQYLKAGAKLSELLFKKASLKGGDESKKEILECVKIVKDLLNEKIPEMSYMYYQLYKWSSDNERLFHTELTPFSLGLAREEARECYNHALECVVWEAIDEEAQRNANAKSVYAAELYLAAAIKYQSPLAFYLAASNYAPSGLTSELLKYTLIPYNACLRCSIALGNLDALMTLMDNYKYGTRMMRKSPLTLKLLETYVTKRSKDLINGLDPYFDEKFSPELIIDLGYMFAAAYGGSIMEPGLSRLVKGWNYYRITIKDPRDRDSTPQSIKEYYLRMWEMLVSCHNVIKSGFDPVFWLAQKIYSNLTYGLPSARPYIFPKEVLSLEIDFTKGLEGYGKEMDEESLNKLIAEDKE